MNERPLFDVTRTTTAECTVCGATRRPTEERSPTCAYDRDRGGFVHGERRPSRCLNRVDPAHEEIPY